MNKTAAKLKAQSGELTIGELRAMIAATKTEVRPSRVNPSFMVAQVCDIFERSLEGRADDERPAGLRPDHYKPERMIPTRDSLTITNILRECA